MVDRCDLSIVIVNWNTRHVIANCLSSVIANLGPLDAEVIGIDNASTDGSAELIARDFPEVTLIANDVNRGFAAGNNQGMRIARGEYGVCIDCRDEIEVERLRARPVATRCSPCQDNYERNHAGPRRPTL